MKLKLKCWLTKLSAIFATALVTAIGRTSLSILQTGTVLGLGVILESFQTSGTIPCRNEQLIMAVVVVQ